MVCVQNALGIDTRCSGRMSPWQSPVCESVAAPNREESREVQGPTIKVERAHTRSHPVNCCCPERNHGEPPLEPLIRPAAFCNPVLRGGDKIANFFDCEKLL